MLIKLDGLGFTTAFATIGSREGTAFDVHNRAYLLHNHAPLCYVLERGPGPGAFDVPPLTHVRGLDVAMRSDDPLRVLPPKGVTATGPRDANMMVGIGYHFDAATPLA